MASYRKESPDGSGAFKRLSSAPGGLAQSEIPAGALAIIARVLKARYGFVLESYKESCVKRRIHLRILATLSPSPEAYAEFLTENPAEQELLMTVLTIHVSQFFRNPSTFLKLREEAIPGLLRSRLPDDPLVFWSVGCASGEEPYSLALIMREDFPCELDRRELSIVATDVDRSVLRRARAGVYGTERMAEVTEELRRRRFTPCGKNFRVNDEIRSLVTFREGDLHQKESFISSDLILCRNVLIYLERERQETILSGFADSLRRGGILVLGKSETMVGAARSRFETVCPVERIYRKMD